MKNIILIDLGLKTLDNILEETELLLVIGRPTVEFLERCQALCAVRERLFKLLKCEADELVPFPARMNVTFYNIILWYTISFPQHEKYTLVGHNKERINTSTND